MKTLSGFPLIVAACLLVSAPAIAGGPETFPQAFSQEKLSVIEENLLFCFGSTINGVRTTAALTLRQVKHAAPEYSFDECIIPLMRIVKNEEADVNARIAAALALHDLRSDRGDYAIKTMARFTDNPRVRHLYFALAAERAKEQQK